MQFARPTSVVAVTAFAVLVVASGCSPQATPTLLPATPAPTLAATFAPTSLITPEPNESVAPSPGYFAFDAESILGYYATLGYSCDPAVPSTQAAGYLYRACELVDPEGRTRIVGITTDPAGDVADAFTSLTGRADELVLDPVDALQPFAAFLGALLGETQGESLLAWLAGHLGDNDARTLLGELTVATYSESPQDHSRLYLEIANQAYIESPRPSGSH
jgi:hypothetical protein